MIKTSGLVTKKEINSVAIYLTNAEADLLWYIVTTQISWREGGCLNDGEKVDKKKMKLAESILSKL